MLAIDRFIIDMGMLSYPADFPAENLHAAYVHPRSVLIRGYPLLL